MSDCPRIGVDLIGGDNSPETLFASLSSLAGDLPSNLELVFFGGADFTTHEHNFPCKISFIPVSEEIHPDEAPTSAVRVKKDTSMTRCMQMVRTKELQGMVSIGITAALVGATRLYLEKLENIKRPALLACLPTKKKPVAVIDVGANVNTRAEMLTQFALMGIAFQQCRGIEKPRLALLNIGHEETKGYEEIVKTFKNLQSIEGFCGNIEARDVFQGKIDILVTDGFAGNIFLKTSEGLAEFIMDKFGEKFGKKFGGSGQDLPKDLNYAEYPGAILCGANGIVIKCHGYSNGLAILSGIKGAINLIEDNFIDKMGSQLRKT